MIRKLLFASAAVALVATAPADAAPRKASAAAAARLPASNPFASPSTLPFQSPDFARIKSSDYLPALLAGIAEQKAEIARIANNPAPPTFANTVVAMERSGQLFERANLAFLAVKGANSDDVLEATDTKASPLWAPDYSRPDYIFLNQKLFHRFKALHDRISCQLDAFELAQHDRPLACGAFGGELGLQAFLLFFQRSDFGIVAHDLTLGLIQCVLIVATLLEIGVQRSARLSQSGKAGDAARDFLAFEQTDEVCHQYGERTKRLEPTLELVDVLLDVAIPLNRVTQLTDIDVVLGKEEVVHKPFDRPHVFER